MENTNVENGGKVINKIVLWVQKYWVIFGLIIAAIVWSVTTNINIAANENNISGIKEVLEKHIEEQIKTEKSTIESLGRIEGALGIEKNK